MEPRPSRAHRLGHDPTDVVVSVMIQSPKKKGRGGEREWVRLLNEVLGSDYIRMTASGGGPHVKGDLQPKPFSPKSILDQFFHEIKRRRALNLLAALKKATEQAGGKIPYIAWRKDGEDWVVGLWGKDFIQMLRRMK